MGYFQYFYALDYSWWTLVPIWHGAKSWSSTGSGINWVQISYLLGQQGRFCQIDWYHPNFVVWGPWRNLGSSIVQVHHKLDIPLIMFVFQTLFLIAVLPPWDQPTLQYWCYVLTQERNGVSVYVSYTKNVLTEQKTYCDQDYTFYFLLYS